MYFELPYLRERDIASDTEVEFSLRIVTRRIRKNFYKERYGGTGGENRLLQAFFENMYRKLKCN
jgi:hypothetical protein